MNTSEKGLYQAVLQRSITAEAVKAAGFEKNSWQGRLIGGLFNIPTRRFAQLATEFDLIVENEGLPAAARWALPFITRQVAVRGAENLPEAGPLIIASNHPGAFDGFVIFAQLERRDIKLITSDVPFTRSLRAIGKDLIYTTLTDSPERIAAVRASMRQLKQGGALFLFPTGVVDPDPEFMDGAADALDDWSPSLEFLMGIVPDTRILPVIVSGVLAPKFMNNFLAKRQPTVRKRQKVAEYLEIAQVLALGKNLDLLPRVSFGKPLSLNDLKDDPKSSSTLEAIKAAARQLLSEHAQANPRKRL